MYLMYNYRSTWDIFQTIPRERKSNSETSLRVLKFIKVLMYGFLFIMVLGTAVMAKFSFIVLATNAGLNKLAIDYEKVCCHFHHQMVLKKNQQCTVVLCYVRALTDDWYTNRTLKMKGVSFPFANKTVCLPILFF